MSKGGPRFGVLQQGRGDAVGAVSGLEQQRQVKSSLCGTDWPAVGSRGLEAVCSALCLGRLLKGPSSCRRMAAKKKEGVLQVSSSQAFSRSCKLSVQRMEFSLGVSQILLAKPHCKVLVGKRRSHKPGGKRGRTWQVTLAPNQGCGVQRELLYGCRLCLGLLGPSTGLAVRDQNASVL